MYVCHCSLSFVVILGANNCVQVQASSQSKQENSK